MTSVILAKVDVVMPFHRIDNYFFEALKSLELSTDVILRIILVDDRPGNPVNFKSNSKFETIVIKTGGVGYARAILIGCKEIKSEYVAFHDSDDISVAHRISLQVADMVANQTDLSICKMTKVDKNGKKKLLQSFELSLKDNFTLPLLLGSFGANSTWVLKSKIVKDGFFIPEIQSLDWGTALSKFQTMKISYLDLNLYSYRSHNGQMTLTKDYQKSVETEIYPLWGALNSWYGLPILEENEFGACCYTYSTAYWSLEVSEWARALLKLIEFSSPREKSRVHLVFGLRILQSLVHHKRLYFSLFELKCVGRFLIATTRRVIFRNLD